MTRTTTDGRVERARRFTRAVLETSVGEARRGRLTIAFLTPDKPQVWDLNIVRVERVPRTGAARAVAREADELLGAAGMTHRRVLVDDEEIGVELTGGLEALGWTPETDRDTTYRSTDHQDITTAQRDQGTAR